MVLVRYYWRRRCLDGYVIQEKGGGGGRTEILYTGHCGPSWLMRDFRFYLFVVEEVLT